VILPGFHVHQIVGKFLMNGGEMNKKELVGDRQYTDEFKGEAARLGESIGGNKAGKRLGIPESSLWNWMKRSEAGKVADGGAVRV